MKRFAFLVYLFTFLLTGFSQNNPNIEKGQSFVFHGKIDKYPITLIFEVFDKKIEGRYYYDKFGTLINLEGNQNDSGYTFVTPHTTKKEAENFTLRVFHNELFGKWTKKGRELSVELWRNTNPNTVYRLSKKVQAIDILGKAGHSQDLKPYYQEAALSFTLLWPDGASDQEIQIRERQFSQIHNFQLGAEASSAIRFNEPIDPRTKNGHPAQLLRIMQRISDTFFAQFAHSVLESYRNKTPEYLSNLSLDIDNKITYNSNKFQVIQTSQSEYTGGAHGNYFQYHSTWNFEKNKFISIEDILSKKQIKRFPKEMTQCFKLSKKIPASDPLDKHGFWIKEFDSVGGSSYFTDLGIHTTFGLYEIAPYSEGLIEVFVPWKNIK